MRAPDGESALAVELVGGSRWQGDTEQLLREALSRTRLPRPYTIMRLMGDTVPTLFSTTDHLGDLLDSVDAFADLLAGTDGVRAKVVLHTERNASADGPALRLLQSKFLDDTALSTASGGVAALVSENFIDAYRNRPGASELSDYRRVLVRSRPEELWAWLRTVPPIVRARSGIVSLAVGGGLVVTGHRDGTVRRWDLTTGTRVGEPFTGHGGEVRAVAVAADVRQIISGDADGIVRRWSTTFGESIDVHTSSRGNGVTSLVTTLDNRYLVAGFESGDLRAWRLGSGRRDESAFAIRTAPVSGLAATSDGRRIVSGDRDGVVRFWNARTGALLERRQLSDSPITALAVSPDGEQLVVGCGDGRFRTWQLRTNEVITDDWDLINVTSVAITPDSREIVAAHGGTAVDHWVIGAGEHTGQFDSVWGGIDVVAVSPDGRHVLAGGEDGMLHRWNARTGVPVTGAEPTERLADVVSDRESAEDALGIASDVHTIAAVLASLTTTPPLSVALLGDWGAGKSSFMRQLRARMELLARGSTGAGRDANFAANLRQVTFNAWHYSDDHLWVGLIEQLFRELATPAEPASGAIDELRSRLDHEQAERQRLDDDLREVERVEARRGLLSRAFAPLRSALVFRAVLRGAGRELRSGGARLWLALVLLVAGAAIAVVGQGVLAWIAGVVAVLAPAASLLRGLDRYTEEARTRLVADRTALDEGIRATTEALDELDPARRLERLIDEICAADRYASFRGLTGRIHHDLRRLSDDLAAARARWDGTETPPLQRIVLYVDDLDRCAPGRVVEVLQAVNLLLTMDLFMVVVAVDPQWLLGSLRAHHDTLFAEPGRDSGPVAYLDKIFHIPFALRPMGEHAAGFLRSLLPPEAEPAPVAPLPSLVGPLPEAPTPRAAERVDAPASGPVSVEPVVRAGISAEGLRVSVEEREFLARLTPLLTTPRAIKKLTNLYRLLRLSVPLNSLDRFLDGDYQAAALLLAALTGAPHAARELLVSLDRPEEDIVDALLAVGSDLAVRLAELIVAVRKDIRVHGDTASYRRWAEVVARYGFETYDLFTGSTIG